MSPIQWRALAFELPAAREHPFMWLQSMRELHSSREGYSSIGGRKRETLSLTFEPSGPILLRFSGAEMGRLNRDRHAASALAWHV